MSAATVVRAETKPDGSGVVVPAQTLKVGQSLTVYAVGRDAAGNFVENILASSGSICKVTQKDGSELALPPSFTLKLNADKRGATFKPVAPGGAVIWLGHWIWGEPAPLNRVPSGVITVVA
jgi:hypothetical protein